MKPVTDYRDVLYDTSEEEVPLKNIAKAKRALSLDSPRKRDNKIHIRADKEHEQQKAIQAAAESLTLKEQGWIQRRQDAVNAQQKEKTEKVKGKTVDPREWGDLELDDMEMDPETQEAILRIVIMPQKRESQEKRLLRKLNPIPMKTAECQKWLDPKELLPQGMLNHWSELGLCPPPK